MIVIGIDPATHTTGYARFNSETRRIYETCAIKSFHKKADDRIREISRAVFDLVDCKGYPPPETLFIETTHFRQNRNTNDMYQQLCGAIVGVIGFEHKTQYVQNTTMKKVVGGSGKADKQQVAAGVLEYFAPVTQSFQYVKQLIESERFDETDALGVGIAGCTEQEVKNG